MKKLCSLLFSRAALLPILVCIVTAATPAARGAILGFSDPGGFTLNANGPAAAAGLPNIVGEMVEMTTTVNGQTTSLFYNEKQDITDFEATFEFRDVTTNGADGVVFVLQNDVRGLNALGGGGHGRGYAAGDDINNSVGILLDIYINSLYSLGTNGGYGTAVSTAPVNLRSGNTIDVTIVYDGVDLTLDLVEQGTSNALHTVFSGLDIPALVGGQEIAWVGFTGATGGVNAYQTISNFRFLTRTSRNHTG